MGLLRREQFSNRSIYSRQHRTVAHAGLRQATFQIKGQALPPSGCHPIADFYFGEGSGIFICESGGMLKGMEVTDYSGGSSNGLPSVDDLPPVNDG